MWSLKRSESSVQVWVAWGEHVKDDLCCEKTFCLCEFRMDRGLKLNTLSHKTSAIWEALEEIGVLLTGKGKVVVIGED